MCYLAKCTVLRKRQEQMDNKFLKFCNEKLRLYTKSEVLKNYDVTNAKLPKSYESI